MTPDEDSLLPLRDALAQVSARLEQLEARLARLESAEGPAAARESFVPAAPLTIRPMPLPGQLPQVEAATYDDFAAEELVPLPPAEATAAANVDSEERAPGKLVPESLDADNLDIAAAIAARSSAAAEPASSTSPAAIRPPTISAKRAPARKAASPDLESLVGGRLLTWAGAATLVVAMAFTLHWVWKTFTTPDWLKVLAFHVVGVGLLGAAHLLHQRELKLFSGALAGLGIFTLFGIDFAASELYHFWPERVSLFEGMAITALAIAIAIRSSNVIIAVIGFGGYLTPIITATGSGNYVGLFLYFALLNVTLIGCAIIRPWSFLKPLALAATVIMFFVWTNSGDFSARFAEVLWGTQWLLVLHAAIFLVGTTLPPLAWKQRSNEFDLATLAGNALWFLGMTYLLFRNQEGQQIALLCWSLALLHAVLFAATYQRVTHSDRMPRVHLALAAIFFTLAIPLQLNDYSYLAIAWCVEGLVFSIVGVYFRDGQIIGSAMVVFALALARLFGWEWQADPELIAGTLLDRRCFLFVLFALTSLAAGATYFVFPRVLGQPRLSPQFEQIGGLLLGIGNLVLLLAAPLQWDDSRLVLLLWVIDAAAIAACGFRWRLPAARWYTALIALVMVGFRLLRHGTDVAGPFQLFFNARFGSLALVAALYFGLGWAYRRLAQTSNNPRDADERGFDPVFGVLANLILVAALSLEAHSWYQQAAQAAGGKSPDMRMAEQATYSIIWAIYAAVLVGAGFILRYPLFRQLGLGALGLILLKVFFIDLASLELLPRVLALAVLGLMLLGVSFLYQKFTARTNESEEPREQLGE